MEFLFLMIYLLPLKNKLCEEVTNFSQLVFSDICIDRYAIKNPKNFSSLLIFSLYEFVGENTKHKISILN